MPFCRKNRQAPAAGVDEAPSAFAWPRAEVHWRLVRALVACLGLSVWSSPPLWLRIAGPGRFPSTCPVIDSCGCAVRMRWSSASALPGASFLRPMVPSARGLSSTLDSTAAFLRARGNAAYKSRLRLLAAFSSHTCSRAGRLLANRAII